MIGARKRQPHELQDRDQNPFSLAQGQMKEQPERERCLDHDVGINRLGASLVSHQRRPGVDGILTDPQGNVAAIVQRLVILVPVLNAINCLVYGMSMGSFMRLGHALHRWLSGLVMSKHDARFSGRQEHLRDLCTKAVQSRVFETGVRCVAACLPSSSPCRAMTRGPQAPIAVQSSTKVPSGQRT